MTKMASLCSGYGGLDKAVERVFGAELTWYAEYDAAPAKVMAHHYPGVPNFRDITTLYWSTVPKVDILTAGYPCQPFSKNGQRKGINDSRHLWPYIHSAIRAVRPSFVILENVQSHLSLGFGDVLGSLASLGYDARWCVLGAAQAGAPHGRKRVFVLASDSRRVLHAPAQPEGMAGALPAQPAPSGAERLHRPGPGDREDEGNADTGSHAGVLGEYADAVAAWERLTRPAPAPLLPRADLDDVNPKFVEWAMGLPDGWVTDVPGLTVGQQLKALGNGVVPQQAELALRHLLGLAA